MTQQAAGPRDILTQDEAVDRAGRVTTASYRLNLNLHKGAPAYRGDIEIRFHQEGSGDLFLDFRGKRIDSLELNGERIAEPDWDGYRLTLPASMVKDANTLRIVYENDYDHGGDGFHQFTDPEDGEEYLYTNFEPYDAHRLFPGFDQPDIKGNYDITVTAPGEWEVIANGAETSRETLDDGRIRREFAPTKRFSTYLFAIVAGPYHVVRDQHQGIDLALYCRKSMAKYLDSDELFALTKQGLDFFGEFFDYPYPWGKYDQLFVPEFNAGAMENVGAVTFNEYMVFRDPPTDNQRRRRAETLLHEMAHMWFGNLVTMRWWNDLWLNESFATYMSYLCLEQATRFTAGWQDFNGVIKNWAYRVDQLVTTHPIAGEVEDTDQTFLNFDGITYGKGASVLKQLVKTIGLDGFREGMRHYFRSYEYGNATLSQFLRSLETGSGVDLGEWSRLWLETSSLNTIAASIESDGERVSSMTLEQTAPEDYPTLRPHTMDIGLYRLENGGLAEDVVPGYIDAATADVPEARGKGKPGLVLPNHGDHDYSKLKLDDESVAFLREHIERFDDMLTRQILWSALWSMVRDQQLSSVDFLAFVREKLAHEDSVELVETVLANATAALARYVPDEWREAEGHKLFESAWDGLQRAPKGDAQITWGRAVFNTAITPEDVQRAAELADGKVTVEGFDVDQNMRWTLATKFCAMDLPGARERLEAEAQRDPSDRGARSKLTCEVSFPDPKVKEEAWEKFHGEGYGSLYMTGAAMGGFHWWRQRELLEPYVERFFERVPEIFERPDREFASTYFGALFPGYRVDRELLGQSEQLLAQIDERLPTLRRKLREANDDLERAIKCREYALRQG
ncbi:MAG: aminopeptidase N [Dehalococcoidia bacterium]|nr:aminopeptidase N [Dehalococcoidia bacterium]